MSSEQYGHERLEWDATHDTGADFAVSLATILAAFIAFAVIL
ncbi:MAG: hypothetical protein VYD64_00165 [Pseudomonadota bacterium]|nr:hypothetical protein [Pseudomonadota bacterium]